MRLVASCLFELGQGSGDRSGAPLAGLTETTEEGTETTEVGTETTGNDAEQQLLQHRKKRCLCSALVAVRAAVAHREAAQLQEFGMVVEAEGLREALVCVRNIVQNIIRHPDNDLLRRIRLNHPAIKVKKVKEVVLTNELTN